MNLDTFVEDCQSIIRRRKELEVHEFFNQELIKAMALLPEIDGAGELEELRGLQCLSALGRIRTAASLNPWESRCKRCLKSGDSFLMKIGRSHPREISGIQSTFNWFSKSYDLGREVGVFCDFRDPT